jgi:hypothetical protein
MLRFFVTEDPVILYMMNKTKLRKSAWDNVTFETASVNLQIFKIGNFVIGNMDTLQLFAMLLEYFM